MSPSLINPAVVTRSGPTRSGVSVPFLKSPRSLAKLEAIWRSSAARSAARLAIGSNAPSRTANAVPTTTGATEAGRVRGRAARTQACRRVMFRDPGVSEVPEVSEVPGTALLRNVEVPGT